MCGTALAYAGSAPRIAKYQMTKDAAGVDAARESASSACGTDTNLARVYVTLGMVIAARGLTPTRSPSSTRGALDAVNGDALPQLAGGMQANRSDTPRGSDLQKRTSLSSQPIGPTTTRSAFCISVCRGMQTR